MKFDIAGVPHLKKISRHSLDPISLQHCPEMVQWCDQDDIIRRYQNAVLLAGRDDLTEGEYAAAKWGITVYAEERKRESEAFIAHERLGAARPTW